MPLIRRGLGLSFPGQVGQIRKIRQDQPRKEEYKERWRVEEMVLEKTLKWKVMYASYKPLL